MSETRNLIIFTGIALIGLLFGIGLACTLDHIT